MDKERKQHSETLNGAALDSSKAKTQFNSGGNESDYDGGHPEESSVQADENKQSQKNSPASNSYNSGGNDSDYDGGHPEDAKSENEGHISSEDKN